MRIANLALRASGASAEHSKSIGSRSGASSAGGVFRGSKRTCAGRARWRLVRGQPPQRLSDHYLLECDYATSTLAIFNEGDPVFLCESHVSAITNPHDNTIAGVRPIELKLNGGEDRVDSADQKQGASIAEAAPEDPPAAMPSAPPAAASELVAPAASGDAESPQLTMELVEAAEPFAAAPSDVAKPIDRPTPTQNHEPPPTAQPAAANPSSTTASAPPAERAAPARAKREAAIAIPPASVRDLVYGNSAKALVDETIWNMAAGDREAYWSALRQGKPPMEAAQAAGGQLAVIHRKIAEYTAKVEAILSESKAAIGVSDAIDRPLEQAALEIIGSAAMGEAEKDAAVEHLGALQEKIKSGFERDITPLQAHRAARSMGDAANWGFGSSRPEEVKSAYRAVYVALRNAIRAAVPAARELDERLANLLAAKSELLGVPAPKLSNAVPA